MRIFSRYNSTLRDDDAARKSRSISKNRLARGSSRASPRLDISRREREREARDQFQTAATARIDVVTERSRSGSKTSKIIALFPDRALR